MKIVSRESLYEAVWTEPAYKVARKFGISPSALAKKCRNSDIPVPERGYWKRMENGHHTSIPPLPEREDGDRVRIGFKVPLSDRCLPQEDMISLHASDREQAGASYELDGHASPTSPLANQLNRRLVDLSNAGNMLLNVEEQTQFRVCVAKGSVARVVKIVDELSALTEIAGVELSPTAHGIAFLVGGETVRIAITELIAKIESRVASPTGQLALVLGDGKTGDGIRQRFVDSGSQCVEGLLPLVIGSVVSSAVTAQRRKRRARDAPARKRDVERALKQLEIMNEYLIEIGVLPVGHELNFEKDVILAWAKGRAERNAGYSSPTVRQRVPGVSRNKANGRNS